MILKLSDSFNYRKNHHVRWWEREKKTDVVQDSKSAWKERRRGRSNWSDNALSIVVVRMTFDSLVSRATFSSPTSHYRPIHPFCSHDARPYSGTKLFLDKTKKEPRNTCSPFISGSHLRLLNPPKKGTYGRDQFEIGSQIQHQMLALNKNVHLSTMADIILIMSLSPASWSLARWLSSRVVVVKKNRAQPYAVFLAHQQTLSGPLLFY